MLLVDRVVVYSLVDSRCVFLMMLVCSGLLRSCRLSYVAFLLFVLAVRRCCCWVAVVCCG